MNTRLLPTTFVCMPYTIMDAQLVPKHLEYDTLSDRHGYYHLNRYNHKNPTSHIKEVGFFISK